MDPYTRISEIAAMKEVLATILPYISTEPSLIPLKNRATEEILRLIDEPTDEEKLFPYPTTAGL